MPESFEDDLLFQARHLDDTPSLFIELLELQKYEDGYLVR
jgi:hypothetical protein